MKGPLGAVLALPHVVSRYPRATGVAGVLVLYAAVAVGLDGLAFPVRKDEVHFWPTVLRFAVDPLPSPELLRNYGELSTPLPFLLFGWLEALTGGGIVLARYVNLAASLAVTLTIVLASSAHGWRAPVAALGLLAFPYYLGVSAHVYTDIVAAGLTLAGLIAHLGGRYVLGALAFVLAISSRQYAFAFPAGLAIWEAWRSMRASAPRRQHASWVAPLVACSSLLGWFMLFGGFAPPAEVARQQIPTAELLAVRPSHALYFLTTVGAYYVVVEWLLLGNRRRAYLAELWGRLARPPGAAVALGLLGLFALFPPVSNTHVSVESMGYLDKAVRLVLPDAARMALFYALALAAWFRFGHGELPVFLVMANAAVILKAHLGWEKYALPLLVVLWYLQARHLFDVPGERAVNQAEARTERVRADGAPGLSNRTMARG